MKTDNSSLDYKASMMQGGLLNQEKPFLLPADFQPSKWDITIPCGWVKSKEHSGNARFLEMCEQQLENYEKCTSKVERSIVIHRIVLSVMAGSPTQTGFVNRDKATGRWHFIGMTRARERVGYVLRRAIADKKAKQEKVQNGEAVPEEPKKKAKKTKPASKKQEQTGIAWTVDPSKLTNATTKAEESDLAASASKNLSIRRRKLPVGLTNGKVTSMSCLSEEEEEAQQAFKRPRIVLPTASVITADTLADGKDSPQSVVLSQALSIAQPTSSEVAPPSAPKAAPSLLPASAASLLGAGSLSSSLFSSLTGAKNDIYLEAAIREHAAALREKAALREFALREQAADAVLRERLALREQAAMQDRLALQEETILRERIKMHEEAALRERLALQERLNRRASEAGKSQPVAEALAAAKAKKAAPMAGGLASSISGLGGLTPAQRLAFLGTDIRALYPGLGGY